MKALLGAILLILAPALATAAPFIVCNPNPAAVSYTITGPYWMPKAVTAQADGSVSIDVEDAVSGVKNIIVLKACDKASSCTSDFTFTFTRMNKKRFSYYDTELKKVVTVKLITNSLAAVLAASSMASAEPFPTLESEIIWRSFQASSDCIAVFENETVHVVCSDRDWYQCCYYSNPIVVVSNGDGSESKFIMVDGSLYLLSLPVTALKEVGN